MTTAAPEESAEEVMDASFRLLTLQAQVSEVVNRNHVENMFVRFVTTVLKKKFTLGPGCWQYSLQKLGFEPRPSKWMSMKNQITGHKINGAYLRWASALVTSLFIWQCNHPDDEVFDPIDFEIPFDLEPPMSETATQRWNVQFG